MVRHDTFLLGTGSVRRISWRFVVVEIVCVSVCVCVLLGAGSCFIHIDASNFIPRSKCFLFNASPFTPVSTFLSRNLFLEGAYNCFNPLNLKKHPCELWCFKIC